MPRTLIATVTSRYSPYRGQRSADLWEKITAAATTKRGVLRGYAVRLIDRKDGKWFARVEIFPRRRAK